MDDSTAEGVTTRQGPAADWEWAPVKHSTTGGVRAAVLAGLGAAVLATAGQPAPACAQEAGGPPVAVAGPGPAGRRDPFVRPVAPRIGESEGERPRGLSGLAVDDAVLRGVVRSREGRVAVLEAPDGRTYPARRADRLYDGAVREITRDAVLILRDAGEAAPAEAREVRKRLRGPEGAR